MENNKSVWDDIKKVWGRIAAVIVAVGTIATVVTQVFHTPPEFTYTVFICIGLVLLIVSFYVDKQTQYTNERINLVEHRAREDFTKAMQEQKKMQEEYKQDSDNRIESFKDDVKELIETTKETRRDTLRIQLLMILTHQPENVDTILKLAETYFVNLHGDWYMTSEFNKWAKAHDVIVPNNIYKAMDDTHKNNEE